MREKLNFAELDKILAQLPPVREPDTLYTTDRVKDQLADIAKPKLIAPSDAPGFHYAGLEILSYPSGTILFNKATGDRVVIDDQTIVTAVREDTIVVTAGRAALNEARDG
jgi:hypothetical protein